MISKHYQQLQESGDAVIAIAELIYLFQTDALFFSQARQILELARIQGKFDKVKFGGQIPLPEQL